MWPYSTPATLRGSGGDFYSHKGVGVATGLDQATVQGYLAGDGAAVSGLVYLHDDSASNYTPLRNGILSVDPDSTNLLTAEQRDAENAPNGYHQYGTATLTANTSHYWQGTKSVKAVTAAGNSGIETDAYDPGAGSATKTYSASVYVKSGEVIAQTFRFILYDVTNGVGSALVSVAVQPGEWTRFAASITIGGVDCRDLRIRVYASPGSMTLYCDGFQIEEQDYPTAWVDGARGGVDDLGYDFDFNYSFTDWSAGIWFWGPAVARQLAVDSLLWQMQKAGSSVFSLLYRRNAANDQIRWVTSDGVLSAVNLDTGAGDVDWEAWNFIGVSFRVDPETGETRAVMRLINGSGSTTYTDNTAVNLVVDDIDTLYVGNSASSDHWTGHLAEFMLFPFAVPVGVWDGIASTLGQVGDGSADAIPLPQWTRKLVTGDMGITQPIGSPARLFGKLFEGDVGGVDMIVGDARNNLGAVSFALEEV